MALFRKEYLWWAALLVVALLHALFLAHTEDDAFITFRYAQHLAEGRGPVWNLGEAPVEGYTNFLWMLWSALGIRLGFPVVEWAHFWGIALFGLNLFFSWKLIRLLLPAGWSRWSSMALVAFSYSLSAYATSGLESGLEGALWTGVVWATLRLADPAKSDSPVAWWALLGLGWPLLVLNRLDGLLLVLGSGAFLVWSGQLHRANLKRWALPLLVGLGVLVAWEIWRLNYYGMALPNTFYAKTGGWHLEEGLFYVGMFFANALIFPLVIFLFLQYRRWDFLIGRPEQFLIGLLLGWCAYLVWIGGDYMEFRRMVPVIPVIWVLTGKVLWPSFAQNWVPKLVFGFLLITQLVGGAFLGYGKAQRFITPVHAQVQPGSPPYLSLESQAREIHRLLGRAPDLRIASGNIGAYGYYNEFQWVDLYGINDRWVARHGLSTGWGPGHRKIAPWHYLAHDRKVHLVTVACHHETEAAAHPPYSMDQPSIDHVLWDYPAQPVPQPKVLRLEAANGFVLLFLYLYPHSAIEKLVAENQAQIHPLLPPSE